LFVLIFFFSTFFFSEVQFRVIVRQIVIQVDKPNKHLRKQLFIK